MDADDASPPNAQKPRSAGSTWTITSAASTLFGIKNEAEVVSDLAIDDAEKGISKKLSHRIRTLVQHHEAPSEEEKEELIERNEWLKPVVRTRE
jgi:hypothetical protein